MQMQNTGYLMTQPRRDSFLTRETVCEIVHFSIYPVCIKFRLSILAVVTSISRVFSFQHRLSRKTVTAITHGKQLTRGTFKALNKVNKVTH